MLASSILVWKKLSVISNLLHIFPRPASARMSSIWGRGYQSDTILAFNAWKLFTQRGRTVLSVFGIRKEGEEYSEEDGRMRPASTFFSIDVCHASQNLRGQEYERDVITLSAFFSLILQVVCVGNVSACGKGWKTSLYSSLISLCSDFRQSIKVRRSIFVCMAAIMSELQSCS